MIVYKVLRNSTIFERFRRQRKQNQSHHRHSSNNNKRPITPYDRIMVGLSSTDIIASLSYALGPFLVPQSTSQRVWAIGNVASCTTLGFLTQLSFWSVWYNCMLSFYWGSHP